MPVIDVFLMICVGCFAKYILNISKYKQVTVSQKTSSLRQTSFFFSKKHMRKDEEAVSFSATSVRETHRTINRTIKMIENEKKMFNSLKETIIFATVTSVSVV